MGPLALVESGGSDEGVGVAMKLELDGVRISKREALWWLGALAVFLAGMGALFLYAWMISRRFA